jgi:hypothetical protein
MAVGDTINPRYRATSVLARCAGGADGERVGSAVMSSVTIADIDERMRQLPPDKLAVVYDFVSYLLDRDLAGLLADVESDARAMMLASEAVLGRDWSRPEEDAAWAHL